MPLTWTPASEYEDFNEAQCHEVEKLCFKLGFRDESAGLPSRGSPNTLLDDLKAFVVSHLSNAFPLRPRSVAWLYLGQFGAGQKYWAVGLEGLLRFPEDAQWYSLAYSQCRSLLR